MRFLVERGVSYIFMWYVWRFTLFFFPSQSPIACLFPIHSTKVSRIPVLINNFLYISAFSSYVLSYQLKLDSSLRILFSSHLFFHTLCSLGWVGYCWKLLQSLSATFIIPSVWWKFIALRLILSGYILPTLLHYWHWFPFGSSLPHSLRTLAPNYMLSPSITLAS